MNKNQTELNSLNVKTKVIQKSVGEIEEGMEFANFQIEELKKKDEENADKNKKLEDQLLYQEVYSRRENMRFFGIPEATQGHEDTGEVIHKFIRDELNIDGPGSIEFQRVHWLGKRINGQSRPIIVHFLKLPEHELVFRSVRELGEDTDVKVYAKFSNEIRERRKKQWPRMKKAREEGKMDRCTSASRSQINYTLMANWFRYKLRNLYNLLFACKMILGLQRFTYPSIRLLLPFKFQYIMNSYKAIKCYMNS